MSETRQQPSVDIVRSACILVLAANICLPRFISVPTVNFSLHFTIQALCLLAITLHWCFRGYKSSNSVLHSILWVVISVSTFFQILSTVVSPVVFSVEPLLRDIVMVKSNFVIGLAIASDWHNIRRYKIVFYLLLISFMLALFEQVLGFSWQSVFVAFFGLSENAAVAQLGSVRIRDGVLRSSGLFEHPIILSVAAGAFLPWVLIHPFKGGIVLRNLLRGMSIVIVLLAAYFSGSRTAVIAVAACIASLVGLAAARSIVRGNGAFALLVVCAASVCTFWALEALDTLISGSSGDESFSSQLRMIMWQQGMPYIERSPVIGWGQGADVLIAGIQRQSIRTIDDTYLSLLLNSGFIGLAGFLAVASICILTGLAAFLRGVRVSPLGMVVASATFTICVGQAANSITHMISVLYVIAGLVAGGVLNSRGTTVTLHGQISSGRPSYV